MCCNLAKKDLLFSLYLRYFRYITSSSNPCVIDETELIIEARKSNFSKLSTKMSDENKNKAVDIIRKHLNVEVKMQAVSTKFCELSIN